MSLKDVVCLCAGPRDDEAWEEFVSRVGRPISLTIMRTARRWEEPSRSLVEDLVQITYFKLWEDDCRHLRDFAIQHPEAILGYVKITAANATHDHFKHVRSQSSGSDKPHVSTSDDGGEPITVRAARRVGDILKCVREGQRIQPSFRFYM